MASNNFINECKNRANANRLGKIIVDNDEITNSDNLQSFEIDSGCYIDGNIIGSVYAKCLKASFVAVPQNINLLDKIIYSQIGVKYSNNSTEYINMGKYTVERPNNEITANMSQITAYDDLYTNLDKQYVCNVDYLQGNKTVADLYIDVCSQMNLIPKTTTFINSAIQIEDNPFTNGEKNRKVLQTIGKIACAFIDIDNDSNEIDLCWLSDNEDPDYTFYKNDYVNVVGGDIVCGPINCLIIKNSSVDDENVTIKDDESIEQYGEHSIIINEDYILHNAELRQQAIIDIWNRVHGMTYVDCELTTYYGKPFLKLGNKIRVYKDEDSYFDTYVLKHKFSYDGTFGSVIGSPALTEQEIKTKQDISLGQALRNTQFDINKQKQQMTALVEQTNNNTSQIAQTQMNLTNIQNLFQITGGNNLIKNSVGLFDTENWIIEDTGTYEFGEDNDLIGSTTSRSKISISNGTLISSNTNIVGLNINDVKTLCYKVKQDANTTTTIKLYGLDEDRPLYTKTFDSEITRWREIYDEELNRFNIDTPNLTLKIESTSTYDGKFYISDLMLNNGDKTEWQLSAGEIWGAVIKLSQMGISVYSSNTEYGNWINMMDTQGFGIYELNGNTIGAKRTDLDINGLSTINGTFEGKITQKKLVHDVIQSNGHDVYVEYIRG